MGRVLLFLALVAAAAAGAVWMVSGGEPSVVPEPGSGPGSRPGPGGGLEEAGVAPTPAASQGEGVRTARGVVLGPGRTPLAGATVTALPDGPTTTSGEDGGFALRDLPQRTVLLRFDHADCVPLDLPLERQQAKPFVQLSPALRAWFRAPPDAPWPGSVRLSWLLTEVPFTPRETTLAPWKEPEPRLPGAVAPEPGAVGPVRLPADLGSVAFSAFAEGFEPWTNDDDPPPRGGDRVYEVRFVPRAPTGGLVLEVRGAAGAPVDLAQRAFSVRAADGTPAQVQEAVDGASVRVDGLAPGVYRAFLACPGHGAASVEVTVPASGVAKAQIGLPREARVRVRAPGVKSGVLARLVADGLPAYVWVIEDGRPVGPARTAFPVTENDVEVGGLAPGAYQVETLAPSLEAPVVTVVASADATAEVQVLPVPKRR